MQRIKHQVDQLQQQLAGLSPGQKVLAVALVAVMGATVVWWGHYAVTSENVALFESSLDLEHAQSVTNQLSVGGIEFNVESGRIFVPSHRRQEAIALLGAERLLPTDMTSHLGEAIGKISSFDPRAKTEMMHLNALQQDLARMLRESDGVRSAAVQINTLYRQRLGESLLPTASVQITTYGNTDIRQLAEAAARLVAGSVSALKPENVTVVIDGRAVDVAGSHASGNDVLAGGSHFLRVQADAERHFSAKVREALGGIPGLAVTVFVEINDTASRRSVRTVDKDSVVVAPKDALAGAGGGGVETAMTGPMSVPLMFLSGLTAHGMSDFGTSIGGGAADSHSEVVGDLENAPEWGRTQEETFSGAGKPTPTGCSLVVPMSWIVQQWQARNRTTALPEQSLLDQFESEKLENLRHIVSAALGGLSPAFVSVLVDADRGLLSGSDDALSKAASAGAEEPTAGISALIRDYGKEVAVAAVAAVSVLLAATMLKKGALFVPPSAPAFDGSASALVAGQTGTVGEAASVPLAVGALGETPLNDGEIVDQVHTLMREHPDAAAALLGRWLHVS